MHRDRLEHDSRYVRFDFPALCQRAVETCHGAQRVMRCVKKEGGFNRVFLMELDDGQRVVARVPFPVAGPSRLITNSEVATITYGQRNPLYH